MLNVINFHVCAFEEEINNKKTTFFIYFVLFCMNSYCLLV